MLPAKRKRICSDDDPYQQIQAHILSLGLEGLLAPLKGVEHSSQVALSLVGLGRRSWVEDHLSEGGLEMVRVQGEAPAYRRCTKMSTSPSTMSTLNCRLHNEVIKSIQLLMCRNSGKSVNRTILDLATTNTDCMYITQC